MRLLRKENYNNLLPIPNIYSTKGTKRKIIMLTIDLSRHLFQKKNPRTVSQYNFPVFPELNLGVRSHISFPCRFLVQKIRL